MAELTAQAATTGDGSGGAGGGGAPRALVTVLAFSGLLGTLMQALLVPVLSTLPGELHTSATSVAWLVTALLISGTVASAVLGRLADLFGKRRVILIALGIFVAGSFLGAVTTEIGVLIFARVLQGAALALVPIAIGVLRDHLHGRQLVGGIALISTLTGVGGTLGAVLGGLIAQYLPWQWLFIGSGILGVLALIGTVVFVPALPAHQRGRIDIVGALGLGAGLVAVLLAVSKGGAWGWNSPATLGCLAGGIVLLVLWAWFELHIMHPLIDLRVLRSRPVLLTNLVTLLTGFGMYGIMIAGPQLVQVPAETGYGLGQSVLVSGLMLLPSTAFALASPIAATRIIHRFGPRTSIAVGAIVLIAGYASLILWHSSVLSLVIANILVMMGISFTFSATPIVLARNVHHHRSAEANGVNGVFRTIGTSASSAVISALLAGNLITEGYGAGSYPTQSAFVTTFLVTGAASVLIIPFLFGIRDAPDTEGKNR